MPTLTLGNYCEGVATTNYNPELELWEALKEEDEEKFTSLIESNKKGENYISP